MPAWVGAIKVTSVGDSSVVNIGDVYSIAPWSSSKTFAGAGSFLTGDGLTVHNDYSETNTYDLDTNDQNQISLN
jgi:spore germination protein PA